MFINYFAIYLRLSILRLAKIEVNTLVCGEYSGVRCSLNLCFLSIISGVRLTCNLTLSSDKDNAQTLW